MTQNNTDKKPLTKEEIEKIKKITAIKDKQVRDEKVINKQNGQ